MHMVQMMPLPLAVSCFSKIQIGFTFLVPAHPGSQRSVKWVLLLLLLFLLLFHSANMQSTFAACIVFTSCRFVTILLFNCLLATARQDSYMFLAQYLFKHELEIISTLLRWIRIPPPTAPPGESLCIKTGNQIGGWVYSRFDHVIHGGPKYTNF